MGVIFYGKDYKVLADMSNGRAHLFVAISNLAAERYVMPAGVSHIANSACYVEKEAFCALVEKVVEDPINLLYVWAEEASAMYEVLQGYRCQWIWRERDLPRFPFEPIRQQGLEMECENEMVIGKLK